MKLILIFPIETTNSLSVFLLINANTINSKTLLVVLFLYLAIIVLDNSVFLVGLISVLRDNYYF